MSVYMCVYGTGVCGVYVSVKCVCVREVYMCAWDQCVCGVHGVYVHV